MAVNCKVSNDYRVIACSSGIRKHTPKNPGHPLHSSTGTSAWTTCSINEPSGKNSLS